MIYTGAGGLVAVRPPGPISAAKNLFLWPKIFQGFQPIQI
jgi:hypothetical protein